MMKRTHQAIREALSKERLIELAEKIEKNKEDTINDFIEKVLNGVITPPHIQLPTPYHQHVLLDAREILDELLHGNIERINVAKVNGSK